MIAKDLTRELGLTLAKKMAETFRAVAMNGDPDSAPLFIELDIRNNRELDIAMAAISEFIRASGFQGTRGVMVIPKGLLSDPAAVADGADGNT